MAKGKNTNSVANLKFFNLISYDSCCFLTVLKNLKAKAMPILRGIRTSSRRDRKAFFIRIDTTVSKIADYREQKWPRLWLDLLTAATVPK